ncbi:MAG: THUMP-like domain-containing protein [Schleiferiaceae bacterium]
MNHNYICSKSFPSPKEIYKFKKENAGKTIQELRLKYGQSSNFQVHIDQLEIRQKMSQRFPKLINRKDYIFPKASLLSQASSEATARWWSTFMSTIQPLTNILEANGGSGIDTWGLEGAGAKNIDICETNESLCEVMYHNSIGCTSNRNIFNINVENFKAKKTYDWIYADPSRIDPDGKRVFHPEKYSPNPLDLIKKWEECASYVAIKLSPMLDPQQVLRWFTNCKYLITLSVQKEVKELIMISSKARNIRPKRFAVDIKNDGIENYRILIHTGIKYNSVDEPGAYVYDPDPAIVASNGVPFVAKKWNLKTLHISSRILTSSDYHSEFPGRIFKVMGKEKPYSSDWPIGASVVSRNFPENNDEIRRRLKCKENKEHFLFAYEDTSGNKWFLRCQRIFANNK